MIWNTGKPTANHNVLLLIEKKGQRFQVEGFLEYDQKAIDAIVDFMEHYAKYYHREQIKSVDLVDVGGSLLRETAMRANLAMPENDQDLKWFEETCDRKKSGDFMERLFDGLRLGKQ